MKAPITRWAETIRQHADSWRDAFIYFKHEEQGKGPEFAALFRERKQPMPAPEAPVS